MKIGLEKNDEYFQRIIIYHTVLGLVYSWLSFDESFGMEDLESVEKKNSFHVQSPISNIYNCTYV